MENISTYLGPKGYSIIKEYLSIEEQELIRKELTVTPFVPKTSPAKPSPFPVYRESKRKFYLPRFYGLEHYGNPEAATLSAGQNIALSFKGKLRPYQIPLVNTYLKKAKKNGCGLLDADCGAGKTCCAIYILAKYRKKTLIIVHKEFLLRQWTDRLKQFLPGARIGRIQGPIIDTENKDVVLGMLQSLSMKEYPRSLFAEFGFTIVDEVHHISAEVFSRALFKTVTPYMLGLSATMNRADGLTRIFKMFMGPVLAVWRRGPQENVHVKAIYYEHADPTYSADLYNFKGQINYVKMIGKICTFPPRIQFLLSVIKDTWKAAKGQQIMVIAHQKNLLKELHDTLQERAFATVGYYIGGMKEEALKISEGKNIIIATYKMAEEALDIKTLTTIVMATPKKDVRQAVGRILRTKGTKVVVDIIDQHAIFRRHWTGRRRWYQRQKFNILQTTTEGYKKKEWTSLHKSGKISQTNLLQGKCFITD